MKTIPLTQNKVAIVDDEYYQELNKYKWYANKQYGDIWYAQRWSRDKNGDRILILMHREIMGFPDGKEIDHINRDGLDNRNDNLRLCNHSQNTKNCLKQKNNTSGLTGVSWHKHNKKWIAQIMKNYKKMHLGYFDNLEDAGHAVDKKAKELFGEFAVLNFPEE